MAEIGHVTRTVLDLIRRAARHPFVRWFVVRTPAVTGVILSGPGRGLRFRAPRGHLFYLTGGSEPLVQDLLRARLRSGDVVLDVGAFVGFDALVCARLVGPEGRVISFEPNPDSAKQIRDNARRNR